MMALRHGLLSLVLASVIALAAPLWAAAMTTVPHEAAPVSMSAMSAAPMAGCDACADTTTMPMCASACGTTSAVLPAGEFTAVWVSAGFILTPTPRYQGAVTSPDPPPPKPIA